MECRSSLSVSAVEAMTLSEMRGRLGTPILKIGFCLLCSISNTVIRVMKKPEQSRSRSNPTGWKTLPIRQKASKLGSVLTAESKDLLHRRQPRLHFLRRGAQARGFIQRRARTITPLGKIADGLAGAGVPGPYGRGWRFHRANGRRAKHRIL